MFNFDVTKKEESVRKARSDYENKLMQAMFEIAADNISEGTDKDVVTHVLGSIVKGRNPLAKAGDVRIAVQEALTQALEARVKTEAITHIEATEAPVEAAPKSRKAKVQEEV